MLLISLRFSLCAPNWKWPLGLAESCWIYIVLPSGTLTCGIVWNISLTWPLILTGVSLGSCISFPWFDVLANVFLPWIFPSDYHTVNYGHLILIGKSFWPLISGSLSRVISYAMQNTSFQVLELIDKGKHRMKMKCRVKCRKMIKEHRNCWDGHLVYMEFSKVRTIRLPKYSLNTRFHST